MEHLAHSCIEWNECTFNEGKNSSGSGSASIVGSSNNNNIIGNAPKIKNHTVNHFGDYLYCFGGYNGLQNNSTLLLYSLQEKRWIRPSYHDNDSNNDNYIGSSSLYLNVGNSHNVDGDSLISHNDHNTSSRSSSSNSSEITVQGTPPSARNGHSATLVSEDEENGRIIIIGGWLGYGPLAASDMHILDISNGGKQLRWHQPPMKGKPPGPCNLHTADYVTANNEVYVFRGGNGVEFFNDLHALHVDTLTWREVEATGEVPQQRANHSSALLEETGELFIFGGFNGKERLNDIHILDTATSNWSFPKIGGVLPHPRAGMKLTALRGRLYLFGGSETSAKFFKDLQIFDRNAMTWLNVVPVNDRVRHPRDHKLNDEDTKTPSSVHNTPNNPNDDDDGNTIPSVFVYGHGPGRRAGHTATAVNENIYIFGGSCGSIYLNDLYFLDTDPQYVFV